MTSGQRAELDAQLARMLGAEFVSSPGSFAAAAGPLGDVLGRIHALTFEASFGTALSDVRPYVTAVHALALDLVDMTGAPRNGRLHPAHAEFVRSIRQLGGGHV